MVLVTSESLGLAVHLCWGFGGLSDFWVWGACIASGVLETGVTSGFVDTGEASEFVELVWLLVEKGLAAGVVSSDMEPRRGADSSKAGVFC